MDTPERSDRSLPSPWTQSAAVPAAYTPPPAWEDFSDTEAPASRGFTPRLVLRALRRHWWQLLLLWPLLSAPLIWYAATQIKPSYEATAWLRVDSTSNTPLGQGTGANQQLQTMQTQVQLISSPDVLGTVAMDPTILAQPMMRGEPDPEGVIRRALRISVPDSTNLILVSMSSDYPNEAATVISAVTKAYMDASKTWTNDDTRKQIEQLTEYKKRFYEDITRLREKMHAWTQKGTQADPRNSPQEALNTYRAYRQKMDNLDLEIIDAQATLNTMLALRAKTPPELQPKEPAPLTEAQLDALVQQAYMAEPDAAMLYRQMAQAQQQYRAASRLAAGHDPAAERFRLEAESLKRQNERLWQQKRPELRQKITASLMNPEVDPIQQQIDQARIRLEKLKAEQEEVSRALADLRLKQQTEAGEAVQAQFDDEDLTMNVEMHRKISAALEEAEYRAYGPSKITQVSKPKASPQPSGKKRLMMMAGSPVGILGVLVALCVLLEIRGARVADPDELTSRLRLGVIGVVPPLPSLEPPKGPKGLRDQRRKLEEFVQSLDHLRVTLCASASVPLGEPSHRCVLITSAVGGEGKTTLAAQLAGRCANAGLTTLLVDADLRRPSLGELLEVPEGPGLAEVLLNEATPEEAMVVIGNAGGFHLLPAGSGGHDPSRLLQGERLGQLIARLREAFDIVLIDAPPVLPVPDALLIGRWTDGAVVAVRHDTSRFPLVERAQKRLTSIGVPLLGAVVNGVRPAELSYGAYDYYASTAGGRVDDPLAEV